MKRGRKEASVDTLVNDDDGDDEPVSKIPKSSSSQHSQQQAKGEEENDNSEQKELPLLLDSKQVFPIDCLVHIFEYCPAQHLSFIVPRVCRTWQQVSSQYGEPLLWKQICFSEWPVLSIVQPSFQSSVKSWRNFFQKHAMLLSPMLYQDICRHIKSMIDVDDDGDDGEEKEVTVEKETKMIQHTLNAIYYYTKSANKKLEEFEQYKKNHVQFMKKFVKLQEQMKEEGMMARATSRMQLDSENGARKVRVSKPKKKQHYDSEDDESEDEDPVDNEDDDSINLHLPQRMEHLFLNWLKLNISSKSEHEDENGQLSVVDCRKFSLLGPSGRSVVVELYFYVQGSVDDHCIDDITYQNAHCHVHLLESDGESPRERKEVDEEEMDDEEDEEDEERGPVKKSIDKMTLYKQADRDEDNLVPTNFISDMNRIHKHLGLQSLNVEGLWNLLFEQITTQHENDDFSKQMKNEINRRFAEFKKMNERDVPLDEDFDISLIDVSSEIQYNKGKQLLLEFPYKFEDAPREYKSDKDLVLQLINQDASIIEHVSDAVKNDVQVLRAVFDINPKIMLKEFKPALYQSDDQILSRVKELVQGKPKLIRYAPDAIKEDQDIWLRALQSDMKLIQEVPRSVLTKDFLLAAAKQCTGDTISNVTNVVDKLFRSRNSANSLNLDRELALIIVGKERSLFSRRNLVDSFNDDEEFILEAAKNEPSLLGRASDRLKGSLEFLRRVVDVNPDTLAYVSQSDHLFLHDEQIQRVIKEKISAGNANLFPYANSAIRSDKDLFYSFAESNNRVIQYVDDSLRGDAELFTRWVAVTQDIYCLQFISDSLKNDSSFMKTIIQHAPTKVHSWKMKDFEKKWSPLFDFISMELIEDVQFIVTALKDREYFLPKVLQLLSQSGNVNNQTYEQLLDNNFENFHLFPGNIKSNRQFVERAVSLMENDRYCSYPLASHLDSQYTDDKELMRKCIQSVVNNIKYISDRFRDDKQFIMQLLEKTEKAAIYEHASSRLRVDEDVLLFIASKKKISVEKINGQISKQLAIKFVEKGGSFKSIAHMFKSDRDVVVAAVKHNGDALEHSDLLFKSNEEIVRMAIESNPLSLKYAAVPFRGNKELVKLAVSKDGKAAEHMLAPLPSEKSFMLELVCSCQSNSGYILDHLPSPLKIDEELWIGAIPGLSFFEFPKELCSNKEFIVRFLQNCQGHPAVAERAFRSAMDGSLKTDKQVALAAVKSAGSSIRYVLPAQLRNDPEIKQFMN